MKKDKVGRWLGLRRRMQEQKDHVPGNDLCSRFQRQV